MDSKQFHRRVWGVVVLLCLLLTSLGSVLYEAQMIDGDHYLSQSKWKIASTETVEAARGTLVDRYGRVLVSNRVIYQVTLNTSIMGDRRNQTLLELIQVSRQEGVGWADNLPMDAEGMSFTTDDPYYTATLQEDGTTKRTLTRLGRLAVKLKWILDPSTGEYWNETLPTAQQLLDKMCVTFGLAKEVKATDPATGLMSVQGVDYGELSRADARAVAGVLYEVNLRAKDIYWTPYVFAEEVDIQFISQVKERSLTGVVVEPTTVREYGTDYAAHLLGRVALMNEEEWAYYKELDQGYEMNDTVGKEGVEKVFESYLRGTAGIRTVERSTDGKVVSQTWLAEPEPGDNVVLTLDIDLQKKVEDTLVEYLPNLASKEVQGAACVVMDVHSGDVLAMASYPTFRLDDYSADYNQNLADPLKPLYNRATLGTYAPGSTFKMVTAIAGLEEKIVTTKTKIRDEGVYRYYTQSGPQCWLYRQKRGTHGLQDVSQAITNSCNYYFYEVGRQLGIERIGRYADMFGLGKKTGLELPENTGIMAGPEYTRSLGQTWYDGNTLSVAIGQENSQFTPLQLTNYIATLVNGGTRYSAHLLKEVKSSDFSQVLYTRQPEALDTIDIDPANLDAVKQGMLDLTTSGSVARYFRGLPFQVGAKTGSAQVSLDSESNAVFVCFAPYDDPQVALTLVVERGGGGSDLGGLAAEILRYYFSAQESREEIQRENALIR